MWPFWPEPFPIFLLSPTNCPVFKQKFSSVAQLCPTLCDPMDCNMPGFPVYYQLPELAQKLWELA